MTTELVARLKALAADWHQRSLDCNAFHEHHESEFSEGKGAAYAKRRDALIAAYSTATGEPTDD